MKTEIENEYAKMQEEQRNERIKRYEKKIASIIRKWKWTAPDKVMLFHEDGTKALKDIMKEKEELQRRYELAREVHDHKFRKRKKNSVLVLWICCPLLFVTIGIIHSIDPTHPLREWLAVLFVLICIYFGNVGRISGTVLKRPKQLRLLDDIEKVRDLRKSIAEAEKELAKSGN